MMWDKDPLSFVDDVVKDTMQLSKTIATDMLDGVVDLSPVLTGRFVSNTVVSIDAPSYKYDELDFSGRGAARSKGATVIDSVSETELQNIIVQNNTEYGKYLEGGWSKKAPNGIYEVTFLGVSAWY